MALYRNISLTDILKLTMIRNGKLALLRNSAWHCSKLITKKERDSGIARKIFHNATFKSVHCPHRGLNCVHDKARKSLQNKDKKVENETKIISHMDEKFQNNNDWLTKETASEKQPEWLDGDVQVSQMENSLGSIISR